VFIRIPTSRASFRIRLSPIDVALAAAAPLAALLIRNGELALGGDWVVTGRYSLVSLVFSVVGLQVFRIDDSIPRYMTVGDLLDIAKAVFSGQLMTTIVLFTGTRLDGIPRSIPVIQAVLLGAGLVAYKGVLNVREGRRRKIDQPRHASKNVIFIGLNEWSALVVKFLKTQVPERWRVIALLDHEARWIGRSVHGVQVLGPPNELEAVIEEFEMHGVRTDRVVMGSETEELSQRALADIQEICERRDLDLVFMPRFLPLGSFAQGHHPPDTNLDRLPSSSFPPNVRVSPYFRYKRMVDTFTVAALIFWLLPLLVIAAGIAVLDVGSPVLFWQQRIGRNGRELQIYKLRTLRPPFNRKGQKIPEHRRLSWIGRLLRQTRIDEIPQLLNVLVGDMSLIGPRPLLPGDQPPNSAGRLAVRPGLTGWAQVNGGAHLSATEKDALDLWYICNASPLLDLRILGMTLVSLLRGDRRSDKALAEAQNFLAQSVDAPPPDRRTPGSKPPLVEATAGSNPLREHAREGLVAQVR
jgi:lipopolysaccharide/colanic/teichoic acid biosynthesis glycosyltransferase